MNFEIEIPVVSWIQFDDEREFNEIELPSHRWDNADQWRLLNIEVGPNLRDFIIPTVWHFMDKSCNIYWKKTHTRLHKLWSLLRPIGILAPFSPKDFKSLMFTKNWTRFRLMRHVLMKIYPLEKYWADPEKPVNLPVDMTYEEFIQESRVDKCRNICQWFGYVTDERVFEGTSDICRQIYLWFNLILKALDGRTRQRNMPTTCLVPFAMLLHDFIARNHPLSWIMDGTYYNPIITASPQMTNLLGQTTEEMKRIYDIYSEIGEDGDSKNPNRGLLYEKFRAIYVGAFRYVEAFLTQCYIGGPTNLFEKVEVTEYGTDEYGTHALRDDILMSSEFIYELIELAGNIEKIEEGILNELRVNGKLPISSGPYWANRDTSTHYEWPKWPKEDGFVPRSPLEKRRPTLPEFDWGGHTIDSLVEEDGRKIITCTIEGEDGKKSSQGFISKIVAPYSSNGLILPYKEGDHAFGTSLGDYIPRY